VIKGETEMGNRKGKCCSSIILAVFLAVLLAMASKASGMTVVQDEKAGESGRQELVIWVDSGNQLPVRTALYAFVNGKDQSGPGSEYESYFPEFSWRLEDKSYLTPEQFRQELAGELEQGGGPDLILMDGSNGADLYSLIEDGKLLGLEESVAREYMGFPETDYLGGTLELGQMEGTQYVLPLFVQCPVVFGLKDALEQAGLTAEGGYGTLEEFLEAALEAADSSGKKVFEDVSAVDWLEKYAMPQDGESADNAEKLEELLGRVRERSGSEDGFFGPYESMNSGECLLSGCGFGQIPKMAQNISLLGADQTTMMAVPAWDGAVRAVVTQAVAVNANTAYPKEAAALLRAFQSMFVNMQRVQGAYPAIGIEDYWKLYLEDLSVLLQTGGKDIAPEYAAISEQVSKSSLAGKSFLSCTRDAVTDAVCQTVDADPQAGGVADVPKQDVLTVGVCDLGMGSLHPLYRWLADAAERYSGDGLHVQIVPVANTEMVLPLRQVELERAGVGFDVILSFDRMFADDDAFGLGEIPADLTDLLGEDSGRFEVMELSGSPKGLVYGIEQDSEGKDRRHVFIISDKCTRKEEAFSFCAAALQDEGYAQAVQEAGYEPVMPAK